MKNKSTIKEMLFLTLLVFIAMWVLYWLLSCTVIINSGALKDSKMQPDFIVEIPKLPEIPKLKEKDVESNTD